MDTYLKRCRWGDFLLLRGDMICEFVNLYGEWCEAEVELFQSLLAKESVVIEVGANIGAHAVPLSKICSEGKVFCYEPQRIIFQILCANLSLNNRTNVFARQLAAGDSPSTIEIDSSDYSSSWNYGSFSLSKGFSTEGRFSGPVSRENITVARLDDEAAFSKIDRLDLLKIDAEGHEIPVLDGASGLIERHKPHIFIENNDKDKFSKLLEYLNNIDYHCYWFCSRRARDSNFNRAFWMVQGYDINMICFHRTRTQPENLRIVQGFDDLSKNDVPLY